MRTNRREEGFTLVELLVVMTILGALAGIAIPLLLGQRQRAYDAAMASDLKSAITAQLAHAASTAHYTTELDELALEGYRPSDDVTPVHVRLVGESFVACVKHEAASSWLVYDGQSGETTSTSSDCA